MLEWKTLLKELGFNCNNGERMDMNKKIICMAFVIMFVILCVGCTRMGENESLSESSGQSYAVLSREWKDQINELIFDKSEIQRIVFLDSNQINEIDKDQIQERISHPKNKDESSIDAPDIDMWESNDDGICTIYLFAEGGIWAPKDSTLLFAHMPKLEKIEFNHVFHTENMENMKEMFRDDVLIEALDLSCFDTSHVRSMKNTFMDCEKLKNLDLSSMDTSNVTDMSGTFFALRSIPEINVSNFDTSNVTTMAYMFTQCESIISLDVSNFDTSNVNRMEYMFSLCTNLEYVDTSGFDMSQVSEDGMENMFYDTKMSWAGIVQ